MIVTFDRSYDIDNPIGSGHVEVLDDLKVHVASREVKNRWWGKHLEIDVSVTAPSLDNYAGLAKHFKLSPTLLCGMIPKNDQNCT